ncbi:MAG: ABC transporter substrate-binding protein [Dehalococcoidia bacterium]|nr:ABC transporter substrate-binding protein [Dehalococcoidia bacterium]
MDEVRLLQPMRLATECPSTVDKSEQGGLFLELGSETMLRRGEMVIKRPTAMTALFVGVFVVAMACGGGEKSPEPHATKAPATASPAAPAPTTVATIAAVARPAAKDLGPGFPLPRATGTVLDSAILGNAEEENVRYGGTFRIATQFSDPLDPKINQNSISPDGTFIYEKLVNWIAKPNEVIPDLAPELAESWQVSSDAKTFTFKLRRGVKWQNVAPVNGRELVADDVIFSIKRYQEKDSIRAFSFANINALEAPDKYTVIMRLKEPNAFALHELFGNYEYIVAPELVAEGGGILTTKAIGTGAFILKKFGYRQGASYVRNPDYWNKDSKGRTLPYVDAVEVPFIQDRATNVGAFRTGQLDVPTNTILEDVLQVGKSMRIRIFHTGPPIGSNGLSFNTNKAPWNDVRVRRAFNMLLDKDKFGDIAWGTGLWAYGTPLPWSFVSDEPFSLDKLGPYSRYNPTEAKKLLIEAGFPDGKMKIPGAMPTSTTVSHFTMAITAQAMLKKEGVEFELRSMDFAAYNSFWFQRNYDDIMMTHPPNVQANLNWFGQFRFNPDGVSNTSFIRDPEVIRVIQEIRLTTDPIKLRGYAKFLWDFDTNGSWVVWWPASVSFTMASDRTRNYSRRAGAAPQLREPWLADGPRTSP